MKGRARLPLSERYVRYGFNEIIERNSTRRSASGDIAFRVMEKLKKDALSRLTIAEIADACGFCSPSHFSSTFRRLVGCSPMEYKTA